MDNTICTCDGKTYKLIYGSVGYLQTPKSETSRWDHCKNGRNRGQIGSCERNSACAVGVENNTVVPFCCPQVLDNGRVEETTAVYQETDGIDFIPVTSSMLYYTLETKRRKVSTRNLCVQRLRKSNKRRKHHCYLGCCLVVLIDASKVVVQVLFFHSIFICILKALVQVLLSPCYSPKKKPTWVEEVKEEEKPDEINKRER